MTIIDPELIVKLRGKLRINDHKVLAVIYPQKDINTTYIIFNDGVDKLSNEINDFPKLNGLRPRNKFISLEVLYKSAFKNIEEKMIISLLFISTAIIAMLSSQCILLIYYLTEREKKLFIMKIEGLNVKSNYLKYFEFELMFILTVLILFGIFGNLLYSMILMLLVMLLKYTLYQLFTKYSKI